MAADDLEVLLTGLVDCCAHHLVGDGIGEEDAQIGVPDLFGKVCRHLGEYLCLAVVILTDFLILAYHSVVSADDNNTHICLSSVSALYPCEYVKKGIPEN